jgi:hypothetical protein
MLRLPPMVGTLTLVASAVCALAGREASATLSPAAALVCPDPSQPPAGPPGATRTNDEFMGNTTFQRAMTDVLRLGIAVGFCELRPDTLTLDLGQDAFTSASTDYNFSLLFAAYRALTEYSSESALELRYEDRLVGWYTVGGLSWIDRPTPRPRPRQQGEVVAEDDVPTRSGFHFNAGLGAGAFDQQCRGCDDIDSELGFSGFLSLGTLVNEETVLGIEATGWTGEVADSTAQVYSVMAQVTRYASETSDLFLRAGVGLVGYHDENDLSATGLGFSGRLGYELGNGKVHIVPYFGYVRSFDGLDQKLNGDDVGFNFVISQFQFGLGLSVY